MYLDKMMRFLRPIKTCKHNWKRFNIFWVMTHSLFLFRVCQNIKDIIKRKLTAAHESVALIKWPALEDLIENAKKYEICWAQWVRKHFCFFAPEFQVNIWKLITYKHKATIGNRLLAKMYFYKKMSFLCLLKMQRNGNMFDT